MKVELYQSFVNHLNQQVGYIAKDKPQAARKFKQWILKEVHSIGRSPFAFRRSIYSDNPDIPEMVLKGYKIVYRVDVLKDTVFVIALLNMQEGPGPEGF